MEKAGAVGTGQANAAAKTQIKHAGALAQGGVFRQYIAVAGNDFGTVQFAKLGVQAVVKFVERQRIHWLGFFDMWFKVVIT